MQSSLLTELTTIRDWIRWCLSCFHEHQITLGQGTDDYWDEAVALVLQAVHLSPDTDPRVLDAQLTFAEREKIQHWLTQRVEQRRPLAYISGQAWLAGRKFYVNEQVLIPRSPIVEWLSMQGAPWVESDQVYRILDLCTGSGSLAILSAEAFPEAQIDAVDISAEALAVAQKNVAAYQLEGQIELIQSDVFSALAGHRYDLIISNPPYIGAEEMAGLPAEFKAEPTLALAAGKDGLDIVAKILAQAADYLTDHGVLIVEVGNTQEEVDAAYPNLPLTWLDFEQGGSGVFLLTAEQCKNFES